MKTRSVFGSVLLALSVLASMAYAQQRAPERAPERTAPEAAPWTGFRVCNQSGDNVEVAKAVFSEERDDAGNRFVLSEGWWRVNIGECRILWPGEIKFRYYMVYAAALAPGKGEWRGDYWACVSKDAFTIRISECHGGYNRRRFKVLDTGDITDRYTYNLNP